jgi:group I intron endonuclease
MIGYIYLTTNLINNKIYIGQHQSKFFDKNYLGTGKLILRAIKKYGKESFNVKILRRCYVKNRFDISEKELIKKYNSTSPKIGYNISYGGSVPMRGRKHTTKTKNKISKSKKGIGWSKALREKLTGRKHSEETKLKMSASHMGHKAWNKGIPMTEEAKAKQRIIYKGIPRTEEVKRKISKALKGKYTGKNHPMYGKHQNRKKKIIEKINE